MEFSVWRAKFPGRTSAKSAECCRGCTTEKSTARRELSPRRKLQISQLPLQRWFRPLLISRGAARRCLRPGFVCSCASYSTPWRNPATDDGVLCGKAEDIKKALELLQNCCAEIGLELNLARCKLFGPGISQFTSFVYDIIPKVPLSQGSVFLGLEFTRNHRCHTVSGPYPRWPVSEQPRGRRMGTPILSNSLAKLDQQRRPGALVRLGTPAE